MQDWIIVSLNRALTGAPREKPTTVPISTAENGLSMVRGTVKGLAFVSCLTVTLQPLRRCCAVEQWDGMSPACSLLAEVCCQSETLVYPSRSPSTLEGAGYKAV